MPVTVPESKGSNPARHSNSVVLPAPLGPMSPRISPGLTENETCSKTTRRPKRFSILWTLSIPVYSNVELMPMGLTSRVMVGFGAGILLLGIVSGVAYLAIGNFSRTEDWVNHTYQV